MKYTDEFRSMVVEAYLADRRPVAVANRFGIHHTTVVRWAEMRAEGDAVSKPSGGNGKCEAGKDAGGNGADGNGSPAARGEFVAPVEGIVYSPEGSAALVQREGVEAGAQTKDAELDGEIENLAGRVERAYLKFLLKPESIEKTASKDAAVVYKTVAEMELKREAHRLTMGKSSLADENADGDEHPGLLGWERVLERIITLDGDGDGV